MHFGQQRSPGWPSGAPKLTENTWNQDFPFFFFNLISILWDNLMAKSFNANVNHKDSNCCPQVFQSLLNFKSTYCFYKELFFIIWCKKNTQYWIQEEKNAPNVKSKSFLSKKNTNFLIFFKFCFSVQKLLPALKMKTTFTTYLLYCIYWSPILNLFKKIYQKLETLKCHG